MKTTTAQLHKVMVRRYHTLCTRLGLNREEKAEMMAAYGVDSSLQLNNYQLEEICKKLDAMLNPRTNDFDKWRKRVIASIGGWLRLIGQPEGGPRIRAIACRATKHDNFNDIPIERLRNLYYTFLNKQNDFKEVNEISKEELEILSFLN